MPPDEQQLGQAQEDRVRSRLASQGYTQPFGISDNEIRLNLDFAGKCADFVGYNHHVDKWLVAESKGNNICRAPALLLVKPCLTIPKIRSLKGCSRQTY